MPYLDAIRLDSDEAVHMLEGRRRQGGRSNVSTYVCSLDMLVGSGCCVVESVLTWEVREVVGAERDSKILGARMVGLRAGHSDRHWLA